ncbi:putative transporter [Ectocarpus siliculosus]|uniref:Transporter n=1 Tax=Ectocarpus siliculosus TaxID=2880 RepID=D7G2T1_ECTSI|nr:putative transporter [Ectocarpus siliculosus]|eukprot:CBJ33435.1 putative transporter [Ectocarpus siliculosus]
MPLRTALDNRFKIATKQTSIAQEVLAGVLGWQTVVQSLSFYASLLVGGDESVDQKSTFEAFLLVAGASTMAFGAFFNMPFIVAPSVLYSAPETSFVSLIPTALRLGAGCGISVLVSVLGMRNIGVLVNNSFSLQAFTWQIIVGFGIITAACGKAAPEKQLKKWMHVLGVPMVITVAIYAVLDRSKFQGYSLADHPPLSNWGMGAFGTINFSELRETPRKYWFYISRTFLSVNINVSSILLILIDAVCLEDVRTKVKSTREVDFSNAIGGTKKFRSMACAIPCMSLVGNFMGVTTQAAFVQSMILVFAGGKTGLSAVVTGALLLMTTVMWPLLPLLAPAHVSGALTVVISLRFFTVIKMIDVNEPRNLLMFGKKRCRAPREKG